MRMCAREGSQRGTKRNDVLRAMKMARVVINAQNDGTINVRNKPKQKRVR